MLKSLTIEGFRGIRRGELQDIAQVNILIGPNGCGKSTILDAISLLSCSSSPSDALSQDRANLLAARRNEPAFAPGWWFARDFQNTIRLSARIGKHPPLHFSVSRDASGSMRRENDPDLSQLRQPNLRPVADFLSKVLFLDATRALSKTVEERLWSPVFLAGAHTELSREFETIYGIKVRTFSFTQEGELLVDMEPRPLRLDDLGAGMRIAFRSLLGAASAAGSALLLEEFDAYQYKTSLEKLAAALCNVAERRKIQFFMTTHSLESVHAFLAAAESRANDWIKVFPLSLSSDGILSSHGMPRSDALGLLAAGMDLRNITSYAK